MAELNKKKLLKELFDIVDTDNICLKCEFETDGRGNWERKFITGKRNRTNSIIYRIKKGDFDV